MIVILAGCDCSGKSTCFNKIDKSLGTFIKGVQMERFDTQFLSDLKQRAESDHLYIYDRSPIIDDFVYKPLFTGNMSDLFWMLDDVKDIIKKCTVLYFTCPQFVLEDRMRRRGDEYVNPKDIETIIKNYAVTFEILGLTPIKIPTDRLNTEQTLKKVMGVIECTLQK